MFQLDDNFLAELGLADLPEEQKKAFLQHIYSELEMRVGERLTEGMSDAMLDEFGYFVDQDEEKMRAWFTANLPDYATMQDFQELKAKAPQATEPQLLSEYGAMKWLQLNRPDYPQVVATVLEELKTEIRGNKDQILGAANPGAGTQAA